MNVLVIIGQIILVIWIIESIAIVAWIVANLIEREE